MNGRNRKEEDEVEELLRAAEDSMRLDLTLNSHISHASSSSVPIHPDLDRRFQALRFTPPKSKPNPNPNPATVVLPNPPPSLPTDFGPDEKPQEDDLFARFAALKTSIPAYSSSPASVTQQCKFEEEDEVEKLISWAIDAARLDPSPQSDIDGDEDDRCNSDDTDSDYSVDDDSDDDRVIHKKKKEEKKGKTK